MRVVFALCMLAAGSVAAETALVIRNVSGGAGAVETQFEGYRTAVVSDVSVPGFREFLGDVQRAGARGEPLVIVLSGLFYHGAHESYFLGSDAPRRNTPASAFASGLPLSVVFDAVSGLQGRVIVMLADAADQPFPALDIAHGITVITGTPRNVGRFAGMLTSGGAGRESAALLRGAQVRAQGFVPGDFAAFAVVGGEVAPISGGDEAAERRLWLSVKARDSIAGYELYLQTYPKGIYVGEAREVIEAIRSEPVRAAQAGEKALKLSRSARREIQRDLQLLGFNTRGIDGLFGRGTRGAISAWQKRNGLAQTSFLTADQVARIDAQAAKRAAELEEEARRKQEQQARADRGFWEETGKAGDAPGLRAYLKRFPDGLFADVAQERLDDLERLARSRAQEADRLAWDRARMGNTAAAYEDYLRAYPSGMFAEDARAAIEARRSESANREAVERAAAEEKAIVPASSGIRVMVEQRLRQLGLEPGRIDGAFDNATRRALRRYQAARNLPVTGYIDQQTAVRLLADDPSR